MTPVNIEVENFLGIKKLKFDFKPGVYVMVGRNGAGKSSFFEALFFSLFGVGIRYGQNAVKPYIRRGAEFFRVSFRFKRSGREYEVIREVSEKSSKAVLYEITSEGKKKRLASEVTNVNKKIEQILKIDRATFVKTFLIPQGEIDNLARRSKEGIRNLIMKISGFDEKKKEIRDRLYEYLKRISSLSKEEAIKTLEEQLEKIGEEEDMKKRLKMLQIDKEKLSEKIKKANERINELKVYEILFEKKAKLIELRKKRERLLKLAEKERKAEAVEKLKPHLEMLEEKRKELVRKKKELAKFENELGELKKKKEKIHEKIIEKRRSLDKLQAEINKLEEKKEKLEEIMRETEEKVEELKEIRKEIERLCREREGYDTKRNELIRAISKLSEDLKSLKDSLERVMRRKEEMERVELEWMAMKISESLKDGERCPVCGGIFHKVDKVERLVAFSQEEYERILKEYDNLRERIIATEERLKSEREKLKELEEIIKEKEKAYRDFVRRNNEIVKILKEKGYYKGVENDIRKVDALHRERKGLFDKEKDSYSKLMTSFEVMDERIRNVSEQVDALSVEVREIEKEVFEKEIFIKKEVERAGIDFEEIEEYLGFERKGYRDMLTQIETRIEEYEKDIKGVNENVDEMRKQLDEMRKRIDEYSGRLEVINQEIGNVKNSLRQIKELKKKIEDLRKKHEEYSRKEEVVKKLLNMLSATKFDDYFFEMKFQPIIDIANVELLNLTNGMFQLALDERRNLVVVRNDREGEEFSIEALSGGERTLVSLALAIAISESFVGNVGALFIDEGFSALDYYNREKIAEILKEYENLGRVIIFITHFEDLSSKFANVIRMENGERVA